MTSPLLFCACLLPVFVALMTCDKAGRASLKSTERKEYMLSVAFCAFLLAGIAWGAITAISYLTGLA